MLLAAAIRSLPALPLEAALDAIAQCGLQGVELDVAALGLLDRSSNCADSLLPLLQERRLQATTLDATRLDPSASGWLDAMQQALHVARTLGTRILIVQAGDEYPPGPRRDRLLEQHRQLADAAAALGLTITFDTLPGMCADARGMLQALDALQHPAVRLNFDTGAYVQYNPWSSGEVALQRVAGYVGSVRLTNFTAGVEPAEYPPLGQGGDVDFARTLQILASLAFAGPCTIAFQPATRRPPIGEQCRQWLQQSADHLRGCGWFE